MQLQQRSSWLRERREVVKRKKKALYAKDFVLLETWLSEFSYSRVVGIPLHYHRGPFSQCSSVAANVQFDEYAVVSCQRTNGHPTVIS